MPLHFIILKISSLVQPADTDALPRFVVHKSFLQPTRMNNQFSISRTDPNTTGIKNLPIDGQGDNRQIVISESEIKNPQIPQNFVSNNQMNVTETDPLNVSEDEFVDEIDLSSLQKNSK